MPKPSLSRDTDLEPALEAWASGVLLPATPNLRASVAARLRSGPRRSAAGRTSWRSRPAYLSFAGGLVIAVAVVLFLVWHPSSPPAQSGQSASVFLNDAAHAPVAAQQVMHLVYDVSIDVGKHHVNGRINVWSGSVSGHFTTIELQRRPEITATRFIERQYKVVHTWTSWPHHAGSIVGRLSTTPLAGGNGRLVAAKVLRLSRRYRWILKGDVTSPEGNGYAVSVRGKELGDLHLLFDLNSKILVRAWARNYSLRLVSREIVPTAGEPQLVATYLQARHAQVTPAPSSSAAY